MSICPQVWYPFPRSHELSHAFAFSVVVGFEAVMSFEAAVVFEAVVGFGVDDEVVASIVGWAVSIHWVRPPAQTQFTGLGGTHIVLHLRSQSDTEVVSAVVVRAGVVVVVFEAVVGFEVVAGFEVDGEVVVASVVAIHRVSPDSQTQFSLELQTIRHLRSHSDIVVVGIAVVLPQNVNSPLLQWHSCSSHTRGQWFLHGSVRISTAVVVVVGAAVVVGVVAAAAFVVL